MMTLTLLIHHPLMADSISLPDEVKKPAAFISAPRKVDGDVVCQDFLLVSSQGTVERSFEATGNNLAADTAPECLSEVAIFSESHGALLRKNVDRWSDSAQDDLFYSPPPKVVIPTVVWIVYGTKVFPLSRFATEKLQVQGNISHANSIFKNSKCGIEIDVEEYHDRTDALPDPEIAIGCGMIENTLKTKIGYDPDKMNIYIVNELKSDVRAGVACLAESDNVIIVARKYRGNSTIAHEFGHWLQLDHTTLKNRPEVNVDNIMSYDDSSKENMLTAGQCYRANFDERSYINLAGLRKGPTKNCRNEQEDDEECPGLKREF